MGNQQSARELNWGKCHGVQLAKTKRIYHVAGVQDEEADELKKMIDRNPHYRTLALSKSGPEQWQIDVMAKWAKDASDKRPLVLIGTTRYLLKLPFAFSKLVIANLDSDREYTKAHEEHMYYPVSTDDLMSTLSK